MAGGFVVTPHARSRRGVRCDEGCVRVHSYVADGRRVCWRPGTAGRHTVDAEIITREPPARLMSWWRGSEPLIFWTLWTRAEALAKLSDVPITVWLRRAGLDAPAPAGVRVEHHRLDDLLVCTASAP